MGSGHVYSGVGIRRVVGDVERQFRGIRVEFARRMVSFLVTVVLKHQLYSELYAILKRLSKIAKGLFTLGAGAAAGYRLLITQSGFEKR